MKHYPFYFIFLITVISIISCREELPDLKHPKDYNTDDLLSIFDSFWTGMNNNYIFWDVDSTDWDAVYTKYRPLFSKLNIHDTSDIKTAHFYFQEITAGLVEGHFLIKFNENLNLPSISPSVTRKGGDIDGK